MCNHFLYLRVFVEMAVALTFVPMQRHIFLLLLFFTACGEPDNKQTNPDASVQTNSKAQILNGIVVHESGGLKIFRAFLSRPNGTLINSNNTVRIGDTVCLNLLVKEGWMAQDGFVSLGATQTITAENGEPVLSSPDLFAVESKMRRAKAAQLQLNATLTKSSPDARAFFVQYRVWDKAGTGEVKGYYRLQLAGTVEK